MCNELPVIFLLSYAFILFTVFILFYFIFRGCEAPFGNQTQTTGVFTSILKVCV